MSNINFIPEMPLTWLTCPVYAEGVFITKEKINLNQIHILMEKYHTEKRGD